MQTETIDRKFEEIVQQEAWLFTDRYFCPPETEIYGRSLSTPRYLGTLMLKESLEEAVKSPEADQARAEFFTSVEEGFGTDMELGAGLEVRDFDVRPIIGGKVMAKDLKTPVSDMTKAGLRCAEEKAKTDEYFSPQLARSKWDDKNATVIDEMARGETGYNTRIVCSPFPEEAAAQAGNKYWQNIGYVPHLRRGFVQLYYATETEVITGSLSFDGSSKDHLRTILGRYGIEVPEGETTDNWLQYAITGNMSEDQAKELAIEIANESDTFPDKKTNTVDVTREHGAIVDQVFNESYVPACESLARGYQTKDTRDLVITFTDKAQSFNQHYQTALYRMRVNPDEFTNEDFIVLHELVIYSTIEMMRALHIEKIVTPTHNHAPQSRALYLQTMSGPEFQSVLSGFGAVGAKNGRAYSACGLAISAGEDAATAGNNMVDSPQTTFGGIDKEGQKKERGGEDGDCEFISKECPMCGEKNVKTTVKKIKWGPKKGKKHISGDCGCSKVA